MRRVRGCRILLRRSDNTYPPAQVVQKIGNATATAPSNLSEQSNTIDLSRKRRCLPTAPAGSNSSSSSAPHEKKAVVLLDSSGKVLKSSISQSEAGVALGLFPIQVSNAVRGSRIAHVRPVCFLVMAYSRFLLMTFFSLVHVCSS